MIGNVWSRDWSPAMYFNSRYPPAAPKLRTPANKMVTNDPVITFSWDEAERGVYYQLQVARDSVFIKKVENLILSAGELEKILDFSLYGQGRYYWRVRAYDELNVKGKWSEVRMFKLDWTPPAIPLLYIPRDGAVKSKVPLFRWFAAAGANRYIFEYRANGQEDWIASAPTTLLYYKPAITESGAYDWRVRALDKAGNESVSVERMITINLPDAVSP